VRLLLGEWTILRDRLARHKTFLGTQRRRSLALVGRCREDALRDDPIALRWMRAQLGAMYDNATPEEVAAHFDEWLPEGMSRSEFRFRMEMLAESLPAAGEARALLVSYVAEEIRRLEDHLAVLEPLAERNLALDAEEARWDRTAEGARLAQQILGSYRGSDAALRRLEALQNPRRPGPGRGPKKAEAEAPAAAPAPERPAAAAVSPSNSEPAQPTGGAPNTAEAISEQPGKDVPVSQGECLGSQPAESDSPPGPSMPQTAEPISTPRAYEAILTPPTAEVASADPACGGDLGPHDPQDPAPGEIDQEIEKILQMADERALAQLLAARSREQEQRKQESKERLDQERRQQLEELARRSEAFVATRSNSPDSGGHDPAGDEAGRAPPGKGT